MYPVFGFGGKIPYTPDSKTSMCFALNGDIYNPNCIGINGVL